MKPRLNYYAVSPGATKAMLGLEEYLQLRPGGKAD